GLRILPLDSLTSPPPLADSGHCGDPEIFLDKIRYSCALDFCVVSFYISLLSPFLKDTFLYFCDCKDTSFINDLIVEQGYKTPHHLMVLHHCFYLPKII